jgi:hypothetical protein
VYGHAVDLADVRLLLGQVKGHYVIIVGMQAAVDRLGYGDHPRSGYVPAFRVQRVAGAMTWLRADRPGENLRWRQARCGGYEISRGHALSGSRSD